MDADTPKPNPAQEAFDKHEAQLAAYSARKNAKAEEALERTRPGEKPASAGLRS